MGKGPNLERSLFALNPIRLQEDTWEAGEGVYHMIQNDNTMEQIQLNYYADYSGKIDMDISPVIRSMMKSGISRGISGGNLSENKNVFSGYINNSEGDVVFNSVWGWVDGPYRDEDFTFQAGRFLTILNKKKYIKGLPFHLTAVNLRPGDKIKLKEEDTSPIITIKESIVYTGDATKDRKLIGSIPGGKKYKVVAARGITQEGGLVLNGNVECISGFACQWQGRDSTTRTGYMDLTLYSEDETFYFYVETSGYSGAIQIKLYDCNECMIGKPFEAKGLNLAKSERMVMTLGAFIELCEQSYSDGADYYFEADASCLSPRTNNFAAFSFNKSNDYNRLEDMIFIADGTSRKIKGIMRWYVNDSDSSIKIFARNYMNLDSENMVLDNVKVIKLSNPIYTVSDVSAKGLGIDSLDTGTYRVALPDVLNYTGMQIQQGKEMLTVDVCDNMYDCVKEGRMIYLRYINTLGGWSFLCLKQTERKQQAKPDYQRISCVSLQPENGSIKPDRMMIGLEVEETIKAGIDGLDAEGMEEAKGLYTSPIVDMWDEINQCFIPVYVDDDNITNTGEERQEITVSLKLREKGF